MSSRLGLACMAVLFAVACGGGPVQIIGRVVDQKGSPVSKAEVATDPETDVVLSNTRGFFSIRQQITDFGETQPVTPGVYRIKVKKFGFEELTVEVKVEGGKTRIADLVLEPRTPDITETAPEQTQEKEMEPDEGSVPKTGI